MYSGQGVEWRNEKPEKISSRVNSIYLTLKPYAFRFYLVLFYKWMENLQFTVWNGFIDIVLYVILTMYIISTCLFRTNFSVKTCFLLYFAISPFY